MLKKTLQREFGITQFDTLMDAKAIFGALNHATFIEHVPRVS